MHKRQRKGINQGVENEETYADFKANKLQHLHAYIVEEVHEN